jgi:hypothetical protein
VNISEIKTGNKRKGDDVVEDRYHTKSEYDSLSAPQKKELAAKRLKRGHKPGARDSKVAKKVKWAKGDGDVIKNLKAVKRSVAQLSKQISKPGEDEDPTTQSTDDSSEATPKDKPNRSNAALTRQKKTK